MIEFDEDKQIKKVQDLYRKEEEELAQILAARSGLPYVNFTITPVNTDAIRIVEEAAARDAKFVVYDKVDKRLEVAILSPENEHTKEAVEALTQRGYNVSVSVASMQSLEKAWKIYKELSFATETKSGSLEISNEEIDTLLNQVHTVEDVKKEIMAVLAQSKGFRISKIFEIIVAGALATGASDIHIEPEEEYVRIRYRLDGVLNNVITINRETYALLLSRIKLLSGLKLNIKEDAQDGRMSVHARDSDIEIRTSVLPGAYNESVVLRVLNPKSIAVTLDELGIDPKLFAAIQKQIARPNGMILTTGPTGSGKTTTLYAFLRKVHTPDIKIITIEDPIEYHLPGIVQTQTENDKGYTFSQGLRAALRQDPDIIMVGEIRDAETAKIAVNSAQTGHLVFSTLHTNNAAGTFPRLIDLGINPKVITSAINIAMAQRLVRKLCAQCRKEAPLTDEQKTLIKNVFKVNIPAEDAPLANQQNHFIAGDGCAACNMTGYKGRIGIYEAILTDDAIGKVVLENPSEHEIKKAALPQGMLDMRQDGIIKVLRGVTSFEELDRVIDLNEEFLV
jgi:type II secretory ATPase GspE/PulE/Tfp pilus assembly ATPase PilB-like protein